MDGGFASRPVVVLGFGAAAHSALIALREAGYTGRIAVVNDAGPILYSPVLTSYYVGGRIGREDCCPWPELDVSSLVDEMCVHSRAVALDVEAHEVSCADGHRMGYSKLLIATGAHPVAPGFPPRSTYRPHMLRTMHDAERLRSAMAAESCKHVLVSGTSMVGLKVVEACLDRGVRVTLLGRSAHILRSAAHPLMAARFERLLEERGVSLRLSQEVACVDDVGEDGVRGIGAADARRNDADDARRNDADDNGADASGASGARRGGANAAGAAGNADRETCGGCSVRFSNGDVERFDEVVLAQGVKPNLDFVEASSIEMREGLIVDRFMRTSSPDVFAAGDVAQALDLSTGEHRIIGLWTNAVQQGRCAGQAIAAELAGQKPTRPYPGSIPFNTIHVRDVLFASAGSVAEEGPRRIEIRESGETVGLFVYELRGEARRLVGFNVLSVVPSEHRDSALVDAIGVYRREIMNSYL